MLEGPAGTGKTLVALQVANNLLEYATDTCGEPSNMPLLVVSTQFRKEDDPIMKYLDASTGTRANKIFMEWEDILKEYGVSQSYDRVHIARILKTNNAQACSQSHDVMFGVSGSDDDKELLHLTEALANRWEGRQIVLLVDEIYRKEMLRTLEDQSFPESVRIILVVNPDACGSSFTLPPSFSNVILTTPYRSTKAITRLARFIARCKGLVVPEGDFGSDVEGSKPTFFDVGKNERKMKEALGRCHKHIGDNATILYAAGLPDSIKNMVKKKGIEAGGPWDIPDICHFFYTNTFLDQKILHSKVRKFATKIASRQNSVNF